MLARIVAMLINLWPLAVAVAVAVAVNDHDHDHVNEPLASVFSRSRAAAKHVSW
jgi:hypothetical protein